MTWAWLTLASGVFNALWTARIKSKVQDEGPFVFAISMRWGVAICLVPFAIWTWTPVPLQWWLFSAVAGFWECLSVWTMAVGMRRDYYSTYALSNITPLMVAFLSIMFLKETLTPSLWGGILLVVAGALWLYYHGHWSWWGCLTACVGSLSSLASKIALQWGSPSAHSCVAFALGAFFMTPLLFRMGTKGWEALGRNMVLNKYLIPLSGAATLFFYWALQLAPLSRVSPLVRINLIVGFLLSYFHLGETKGWKARGFGALLLMAGLILVLWK